MTRSPAGVGPTCAALVKEPPSWPSVIEAGNDSGPKEGTKRIPAEGASARATEVQELSAEGLLHTDSEQGCPSPASAQPLPPAGARWGESTNCRKRIQQEPMMMWRACSTRRSPAPLPVISPTSLAPNKKAALTRVEGNPTGRRVVARRSTPRIAAVLALRNVPTRASETIADAKMFPPLQEVSKESSASRLIKSGKRSLG